MAVALFGMCAVLSRASTDPSEDEAPVVRLAVRRLERDFERARAEWEAPDDELVTRVASRMTGLSAEG